MNINKFCQSLFLLELSEIFIMTPNGIIPLIEGRVDLQVFIRNHLTEQKISEVPILKELLF